jgi:hypothetical protein
MAKLTIQLEEADYRHLVNIANRFGKSIEELFQEWVSQLPKVEEGYDFAEDPIFQMEGYESNAPTDLSINIDDYLYGNNCLK